MSLNTVQKKRGEYFLGKPDSCGAAPEGEDDNSPQIQEVRFEQRLRIINPAWLFPVTDYDVSGLPILVRKDL